MTLFSPVWQFGLSPPKEGGKRTTLMPTYSSLVVWQNHTGETAKLEGGREGSHGKGKTIKGDPDLC